MKVGKNLFLVVGRSFQPSGRFSVARTAFFANIREALLISSFRQGRIPPTLGAGIMKKEAAERTGKDFSGGIIGRYSKDVRPPSAL